MDDGAHTRRSVERVRPADSDKAGEVGGDYSICARMPSARSAGRVANGSADKRRRRRRRQWRLQPSVEKRARSRVGSAATLDGGARRHAQTSTKCAFGCARCFSSAPAAAAASSARVMAPSSASSSRRFRIARWAHARARGRRRKATQLRPFFQIIFGRQLGEVLRADGHEVVMVRPRVNSAATMRSGFREIAVDALAGRDALFADFYAAEQRVVFGDVSIVSAEVAALGRTYSRLLTEACTSERDACAPHLVQRRRLQRS